MILHGWYTQRRPKEIISTATSFYDLTNIKVNPMKSTLATNLPDQNAHISFWNTPIYNIDKTKAFRFLGCRFTRTPKHHLIHKMREALADIQKIQHAKITEKQIIYIINAV